MVAVPAPQCLWLRAVVRATCVCVSGLVCCDYLCIVLMQPSSRQIRDCWLVSGGWCWCRCPLVLGLVTRTYTALRMDTVVLSHLSLAGSFVVGSNVRANFRQMRHSRALTGNQWLQELDPNSDTARNSH